MKKIVNTENTKCFNSAKKQRHNDINVQIICSPTRLVTKTVFNNLFFFKYSPILKGKCENAAISLFEV